MSTAQQWAEVLGQSGGGQFRLRFEGLGLEAQCRSLSAGEVEECVRMGGERGLRYALYLACDDLREAGESLKKQGALVSAFDITERMGYGDVVAAGAAVLRQSGAYSSRVALEGEERATVQAEGVLSERMEGLLPQNAEEAYPAPWLPEEDLLRRNGWITAGQVAREFADRLWAAAGNR